MATSGKHNPNYKSSKKRPVGVHARQEAGPVVDYLERHQPETAEAPLLPRVFWAIALLGLLVLAGLSFGSGINADEKFQCDYSQKLVSYYSTFGKDTAALNIPEGNMHLYGGFFEIVSGFANKALRFEQGELAYHNVRHLFSALLGWVAILCAALLARQIAGWQAGIITLVIMLLSPRFVGDSLMNPKDIPFAAGYMMALYNMAVVLDHLPKIRRWNVAGLAGGLAMTLAVRAGGLLPFAYLGMFAGLHFLLKNGGLRAFSNTKLLGRYIGVILGIAVAGYLLAVLCWPYAMQSPFENPFVALSKFADLEVIIRVLYEGANIASSATPWHYPVKWILYTIPLGALAGFVGALFLLPRLLKKYQPLWVSMVFFAGIFPVAYVIYRNSVIHDGWRHLTFVYPLMVVAAGLFWNELLSIFSAKKTVQYGVIGVLALSMADSAWFVARNPAYPYTYFNPLIGGIQGAYGKFETDYWGVSVRQGIAWMEHQGILKPDMSEEVVVATNMFYPAQQLLAKYGDKVKVKYLKWENRCDDTWDYGLYPTRFIDGDALATGKWPPDNAVHAVKAGGVPILAVLKDDEKNCAHAMARFRQNDWNGAIELFKKELEAVPDNDVAWVNLAQAYLNISQFEASRSAAEKALAISPDDIQANNLIGLYWLSKGDVVKAVSVFQAALKREPSNPSAYYFLAMIALREGNNQVALNLLMKAIQSGPTFKLAYEVSARIYESMGNQAAAQRFRATMQQIK